MFESLTERLGATLANLTGKAKLTEENIQGTLREVRVALLEADVALPVVKEFIDRVRVRAVGLEISTLTMCLSAARETARPLQRRRLHHLRLIFRLRRTHRRITLHPATRPRTPPLVRPRQLTHPLSPRRQLQP